MQTMIIDTDWSPPFTRHQPWKGFLTVVLYAIYKYTFNDQSSIITSYMDFNITTTTLIGIPQYCSYTE